MTSDTRGDSPPVDCDAPESHPDGCVCARPVEPGEWAIAGVPPEQLEEQCQMLRQMVDVWRRGGDVGRRAVPGARGREEER